MEPVQANLPRGLDELRTMRQTMVETATRTYLAFDPLHLAEGNHLEVSAYEGKPCRQACAPVEGDLIATAPDGWHYHLAYIEHEPTFRSLLRALAGLS
jgi:hypothetical protein